ncbi:hypothetical protein F5Y18DRAFT_109550 [Xylariaceae sp. FL1019]|nr:hypothetical protein F5Y18DRAFT_109550 [Xylariaceae sp. FL1019]
MHAGLLVRSASAFLPPLVHTCLYSTVPGEPGTAGRSLLCCRDPARLRRPCFRPLASSTPSRTLPVCTEYVCSLCVVCSLSPSVSSAHGGPGRDPLHFPVGLIIMREIPPFPVAGGFLDPFVLLSSWSTFSSPFRLHYHHPTTSIGQSWLSCSAFC